MRKLVNLYLTAFILLLISACNGSGHYSDDDNKAKSTAPGTAPGTVISLIDNNPADNTVIESAAIGTDTGLTAFVDGIDSSIAVTYSLTNNAGGLFAIDPVTGAVTVDGDLDFETASSHVVRVLASKSDGNELESDFTIQVTDNLAPVVSVCFPDANSLIIGDSVTVSGTATDPEGNGIASAIVNVDGNDIAATVDANGNWSAPTVPLSRGDNEITIITTDVDGEVTTEAIAVNSQETILITPGTAIADNARDRILVVDLGTGSITVVDPNSGELSRFPTDFIGSPLPGSAGANEFKSLSGSGEFDDDNDRLFVVEYRKKGYNLLLVDLTNDGITRLPVRVEPGIDQFVVDSANNRLLVLDPYAPAVIAVDLGYFSTSILSDNNGAGAGLYFVTPTRIALDENGNQAIVYDEGLGAFVTVDLDTGDRANLANLPAGITDPTLVSSIEVDNTGNRLLAVTPTSVFTVDLDTGALAVLSGDDVVTPSAAVIGSGPALVDASAITIDGTRALVSDGNGAIIAIDLANGNRSVVASNPQALLDSRRYTKVIVDEATGNAFLFSLVPGSDTLIVKDKAAGISSSVLIDQSSIQIDTTECVVDIENNVAYFFNYNRDGIVALNLASGLLSVVSDNQSVGTGINFGNPIALALDKARNRILYTDAEYDNPSVRAVDIATGDRYIFFDDNLPWPTAITVDAANDRVLVIEDKNNNLVVIDLESGAGTAIPAATNAYLPLGYTVITVDSNSDIAYILSISNSALTSVNIANGETNVVSTIDDNGSRKNGGNQIGNGLGFVFPTSVAWDEAKQRLLATEPAVKGLTVIEPNSGDRIIAFH